MNADIQPVKPLQRAVLTVAFMAGLMALYLLVGWLRVVVLRMEGQEAFVFPSIIDDWIPFSLAWLPLYIFMLPMSWAPACTFVDRRSLKRWVISVALMYLVAIPIWLLMPVTVPRESVAVTGYWTFVLEILRSVDPPVNCLPSMHVAVATLAGLLIRRADALVGNVFLALIPFIWYSTMALDQHWFVDGLVGMVLAVTVERVTHRWMKLPPEAQATLNRKAHLAWIGPYLVALLVVWVLWLQRG